MEFTETSKIILGLVTAIGTIAITYYNLGQTRKIRAELLEKFENALEKCQKHSVTELFRLIHGLRMNYADIVALIQNDECSKIIYVLKKTPGLVHYKNGNVIYSNIAKNAFYRFFDKWTSNISVWLFGLGLIVSFSLLVFGDGVIAITGFILTLVTSIMFGLELHQRSYNRMIANLVEQGNNE